MHYNFSDRLTMDQMLKDGEFIETAEFSGNMYGTSRAAVEAVAESGKVRAVAILYPKRSLIFNLKFFCSQSLDWANIQSEYQNLCIKNPLPFGVLHSNRPGQGLHPGHRRAGGEGGQGVGAGGGEVRLYETTIARGVGGEAEGEGHRDRRGHREGSFRSQDRRASI